MNGLSTFPFTSGNGEGKLQVAQDDQPEDINKRPKN